MKHYATRTDAPWLVYDAEIKNCIPEKGKSNDAAYSYCHGWTDYNGMGISVVCAYDTVEQRPRIFCEDNFDELQQLATGRVGIGFNNLTFDSLLLAGNGVPLHFQEEYDLYRSFLYCKGLEPFPTCYSGAYGGHKLDNIAEANDWPRKSGHGALAPKQWQDGKIGTVIDYCLQDVMITVRFLQAVLAGTLIVDPKSRQPITMQLHNFAQEITTNNINGGYNEREI